MGLRYSGEPLPATPEPIVNDGVERRRHDWFTATYGYEWTDDPDHDHLAAERDYQAIHKPLDRSRSSAATAQAAGRTRSHGSLETTRIPVPPSTTRHVES